MISKIISIVFAVIAGAAALIGLRTGFDGRPSISSNNDLQDPETLPGTRSVGQTTLNDQTTDSTVSEASASASGEGSPSPIFSVQPGAEAAQTTASQTTEQVAADLDPSPEAVPPTTTTPQAAPAPAASSNAPAATTAPAQPVKALW